MIQNSASTIAKTTISMSWVNRFVKRNSSDLILHWTTGIDSNRHNADSEAKYSLYFSLLQQKINQYSIEPRHTYNMDEKGFLLGITTRSKRIFSRQEYERKAVRQAIQDGSREWISLLACICADGSALDPALIYEAGLEGLLSGWVEDINPEEHSAFITSFPSGWSNDEIGLAWLEQVFDRCTREKARRSYRLLILDGHGSHVTMDFINYCDQNRILLAVFPPHSTHTLQPLDVCMFKPLSTTYSGELSAFLHRGQGLSSVAKRDFFSLFWKAWQSSFKQPLILKAFKTTGISPLNPEPILKRFSKAKPESRRSSSSALSASDWRRIERLVRVAVEDVASREAKKLSQTIHSISTQNQLLKHENEGLRIALSTKKKRQKRSKPLVDDQSTIQSGGAVFWSPSKVQAARDRIQQQKAEAEQLRLQKAERAEAQRASKQLKARLLEERRVARAEAREARAKEKADQASERAQKQQARRAQQRLQNHTKLAKKRSKKPSKLPRKATQKERHGAEAIDAAHAVGAVSQPLQVQSRRGRNIRTPSRFL